MREAEDDAVLDAVLGGVLGDARARRGERHEVTPHVPFDAEREIDERLPAAHPALQPAHVAMLPEQLSGS